MMNVNYYLIDVDYLIKLLFHKIIHSVKMFDHLYIVVDLILDEHKLMYDQVQVDEYEHFSMILKNQIELMKDLYE
jgi:hypothetical protein